MSLSDVILTVNDDDDAGVRRFAYSNDFKIVHRLIIWSGMWITVHPSKKRRSSCVNLFGPLSLIAAMCYVLYKDYCVVIDDFESYQNFEIFNIMTALSRCFMFYVPRVESIVYFCYAYFYTYLNYPWLDVLCNNISLMNDTYRTIIKANMKILKRKLVVYFIVYLIHIPFYYMYLAAAATNDSYYTASSIIETVCALYSMFIPMAMCQIYISCITLSYEIYLMSLKHQLSENEMSVGMITQVYKENLKNFQRDFYFWKIYMVTLSLGYFCFMWLYVEKLFFQPDWIYLIHILSGLIFYTLLFIEYVVCASNLNIQFQHVINDLVDKYEVNDGGSIDTKIWQYKHLHDYMGHNEMVLTCFGRKINKTYIIKFAFFFGVGKFLSYSWIGFQKQKI
eukprot:178249_1